MLFVIDSLCLGGAQRQLFELARAFREDGMQVEFLTYHRDAFFAPFLEELGIGETCIPGRNYLDRLLRMRRFIRRGGFDVVISFLEAATFICEVAGLPSRSWAMIAGERSANPAILKNPRLRFYRFFHVFADYVVSNSSANLRLVKKANPLVSERKLRRIFNMVDFKTWYPEEAEAAGEGKLTLVTAARFHGPKNISGLVDALGMLESGERERLQIDWYGMKEGDEGAESRQWLAKNGLGDVISLLPATRDLAPRVRSADAVVLFSLIEGLPNVVCEGMACAKPILCSSISDIPELLDHQASLLFDPRDAASIAASLRLFLRMHPLERARAGKLNLEVAQREFKREKIREAYLQLIRGGNKAGRK